MPEAKNAGWPSPPPLHVPRFSLAKLVGVQRRVELVSRDSASAHPFNTEDLAIIAYALGLLSAERLAAGERLNDEKEAAPSAGSGRACNRHADCDAADAKAAAAGRRVDHCHDECCEECFGT